jgi:dTDP-4-dehydrorhamnose reductase
VRLDTQTFLICDDLRRIKLVTENDFPVLNNIDYVINFGFVTNYHSNSDALKKTTHFINDILKKIEQLSPQLFIQISSMAIFGDNSDFLNTKQNNYANDPYSNSKLLSENIILDKCKNPFVILRLGNVMGEYAPNWTGSIVSKIVNLSTFTRNGWGYSNVTYVHNITDYIIALLDHDNNQLNLFHHLAEFSSKSWDEWVRPMSEKLGINIKYLSIDTKELNKGTSKLIVKLLLNDNVKNILKPIVSYASDIDFLSTMVSLMKERMPYNICIENTAIDKEDKNFQNIIASRYEFNSTTFKDWMPPYNFDEALNNILNAI